MALHLVGTECAESKREIKLNTVEGERKASEQATICWPTRYHTHTHTTPRHIHPLPCPPPRSPPATWPSNGCLRAAHVKDTGLLQSSLRLHTHTSSLPSFPPFPSSLLPSSPQKQASPSPHLSPLYPPPTTTTARSNLHTSPSHIPLHPPPAHAHIPHTHKAPNPREENACAPPTLRAIIDPLLRAACAFDAAAQSRRWTSFGSAPAGLEPFASGWCWQPEWWRVSQKCGDGSVEGEPKGWDGGVEVEPKGLGRRGGR
eukprot:285527-Chlamydomonas_euryale.AAC.2